MAALRCAALETLLSLTVRQGKLSLSPRVPAHWPSFEITLQLDNRAASLCWQRAGLSAEGCPGYDRVLAPGEVVLLAELPEKAHLPVRAND